MLSPLAQILIDLRREIEAALADMLQLELRASPGVDRHDAARDRLARIDAHLKTAREIVPTVDMQLLLARDGASHPALRLVPAAPTPPPADGGLFVEGRPVRP